ncbi:ABC transporter permease [Halobacteria archaeon AArc-m2/3/4]|uniref:ABC transporter permease n=1 Tax=Natronoglomus mannanivorans TaxID=2979990 RepID=A0AAP3E2Z2_9EURY|nr:ABC transporter permease [Halobacteria archaeon AArc-xg1-1]MCU4973488.1 ABC transporter permease [Halobacteria archaeon AArc-m2/3/4]
MSSETGTSTQAPGSVDRSVLERVRSELRGNPLTLAGALIVTGLAAVAIVGPVLTPYDPTTQELANRLQSPSLAHPLGTDQLGRDVMTRLVYGARISLGIAIAVTAIRVVIGTTVGLVAGYAGGWVDEALMRLVDVQLAFPGLVLALVVAGILGPSLRNVMLALAVVGWATYARVVRGSVLSVKEREYVHAAKLVGTPPRRIARRHLLPNVINPVIVLATLNLGTVVLATAGLSFIGLGAQPPTPEWGTMLAGGRNYLRSAWWLVNAPGVAIVLTVLGFNLLGDGLRDLLDPRQQSRLEEV